jgi:hypothetical protein
MKLEAKTRLAADTKTCGCVATVCAHVLALTEKQKQLDIDGDGKIDGDDLKKVRKGKTPETEKEEIMEAKTRIQSSATVVTAAKTAQVKFKDGSVHKVSFFSDPTKRRGTFILKSPDLPSLKFMLEGGKYVVYTVGNTRNDIDKDSRFDTKTAEAADAYAKGIKKFWKAL